MEIKLSEKKEIKNPKEMAGVFQQVLKMESQIDQDKEHFWVAGLNTRNVIKYLELVSLGTLDANLVHPREVFRLTISKGVAQIVVGHNHPSGDPEPSEDDLEITQRLKKAGEIIGIEVIDHIIIAGNDYLSFKEKRLL